MATLDWRTFELTYLRPVLNDVYKSQYNDTILQATVFATIADLNSKGLTDIGPLASSTVLPGNEQINYVTPSTSVAPGNVFYISIEDLIISYTAGANPTVAQVVTGLTTAFNASTDAVLEGLTAYDEEFRVVIISDEPGMPFLQQSSAARGATAQNNPFLETVINQEASENEVVVAPITLLTGEVNDAFPLIAAGVKYFIVSDPVTGLKTTAGLDIGKSEKLVQLTKSQYDLLTYAYIKTVKTKELTKEQFWSQHFQINSTSLAGGNGSESGQLNLADRLALLDAEQQGLQTLQRLKADSAIRIAENQRRYKLEDEANLVAPDATNGVWTAAGLFTHSFLSDYNTTIENTVTRDLRYLRYNFFGLGNGVIGTETIVGIPIDVRNYNVLNLKFNSSASISFALYQLISGDPNTGVYEQVGTTITNSNDASNNGFEVSYALGNTDYIKLQVMGSAPNTSFYVVGDLIR